VFSAFFQFHRLFFGYLVWVSYEKEGGEHMKNTALLVIALVGFVVLAFFAGTHVAGRLAFVRGWNTTGQIGPQAFRGGRSYHGMMMGRRVFSDNNDGGFRRGGLQGQITKIEGNIVTLQLPTGGTYSVTLDDETSVNKITKGTNADLAVGQTISVMGKGFWNGTQAILIQP